VRILLALAWLVGTVYATVPIFWLAIHPFTGLWQRQQRSPFRFLLPFWALIIAGVLLATYPWFLQQLYRTWLGVIPAIALAAIAISIYRAVSKDFRRQQLSGEAELQPAKHEQRLVRTGIHARIRHPVYLGHLLMLAAWTIGSGLLVLYALTVVAIVTGAIMIRLEERELAWRFGDDYRDYQSRVPAILPFARGSR
jgi:protein-S-isoprenylcysteine O-methyltransferase Ste14